MKNKIEEKKLQHDIQEESLSRSWKDEFIVVMLMLPIPLTMLYAFTSEENMTTAWNNLALMPEWYQQLLMIVLLVVFGLKALLFRIADKLFGRSNLTK
jgi:ABC-type spermidine/putrescine transport system permease subunit II